MIKRTIVIIGIIMLCLLIAQTTLMAQSEMKLTMGTGSEGGTYYPVGIGFTQMIREYLPNVDISVEVTGGAIENSSLVGTGQSDLGIATGDMVYKAVNGKDPFKSSLPDVKLLFSGLQPGSVQAVVLKGSGIKGIKDLEGKDVGLGPITGPGLVVKDLLEHAGLTEEDYKASYVGFSQAIQQLGDRSLDAAIVMTGAPSAAIRELGATHEYDILSIEEEVKESFIEQYPFYFRFTIPEDVYEELDYEINTLAGYNTVIASNELDEDLVYKMVKTIFENIDEFKEKHPSLWYLSMETAVEAKNLLPYHPGAIKYYEEQGIEF